MTSVSCSIRQVTRLRRVAERARRILAEDPDLSPEERLSDGWSTSPYDPHTLRRVGETLWLQAGFALHAYVFWVPAPPADASRCPRGDRVGREPEGDVASPHEGSVVLGPVPDAIRCRVLRMALSTSHRDHDPPAVAMVNMPATARLPR